MCSHLAENSHMIWFRRACVPWERWIRHVVTFHVLACRTMVMVTAKRLMSWKTYPLGPPWRAWRFCASTHLAARCQTAQQANCG